MTSPALRQAASGWWDDALEQVLVVEHQTLVIHLQVRFEAARDAEIDVAQPPGTMAIVALARWNDGQGRTIDERRDEDETRARQLGRAADRERVAERCHREIRLVSPVEIRARHAVDEPTAASAFELQPPVSLRVPSIDDHRLCAPVRCELPLVIETEATAIETDDRADGGDSIDTARQLETFEPVAVEAPPE